MIDFGSIDLGSLVVGSALTVAGALVIEFLKARLFDPTWPPIAELYRFVPPPNIPIRGYERYSLRVLNSDARRALSKITVEVKDEKWKKLYLTPRSAAETVYGTIKKIDKVNLKTVAAGKEEIFTLGWQCSAGLDPDKLAFDLHVTRSDGKKIAIPCVVSGHIDEEQAQ